MNNVPVVFIIYNRLETTARVFSRISEVQPENLLIIADGPRVDRPGDVERCETVRQLVSRPTWKCDVRLDFAGENLGFKQRISSGLKWAFEQFDRLIVLEDDCLPEPSFFSFCADMLDRYQFDERVMMITGNNFQCGRQHGDASYYFSHGVGTWGWATWRRSFQHFDSDMREWSDERDRRTMARIWPVPSVVDYWCARFDEVRRGDVDTWDYQWAYAMWRRGGLQIVPNVNLVSYIGCLPDSTHTTDPQAPFCALPTAPIEFPLSHPTQMERNLFADLFEFNRMFLYQDEGAAAANAEAACVGHEPG